MSEKIKAIKGSLHRSEDVKQWLRDHGATNLKRLACDNEDCIYFVKPDGEATSLMNEGFNFLFDIEELPRWRAEKGQMYHYVSDLGNVITAYDDNIPYDNGHYEFGNYFRTREEAEEIRNKIIDLLKERK